MDLLDDELLPIAEDLAGSHISIVIFDELCDQITVKVTPEHPF